MNVQPLTISELEKATSTPRSTIYFYVREGLLPPAQRSGTSRAIYSDMHTEVLAEIRRLKHKGVPLDEIKRRVQPLIARHQQHQPDLVAQRSAQVRGAILQAAARRFARDGYKRTRISDIISDVGITPPVFYQHFASKRQLFIESFGVFVRWNTRMVEPPLSDEPDPVARMVKRMRAHFGLRAVSPVLVGLARSEGLQDGGESRAAVIDAFRSITAGTTDDFTRMRREPGSPPVADELVAHSLVGAIEQTVLRAEWDDAYTLRDVMVTHLFIYLALQAAYSGDTGIENKLAAYLPLIDEALATEVVIPRDDRSPGTEPAGEEPDERHPD
jgi:AcrR family transcriptional regulator